MAKEFRPKYTSSITNLAHCCYFKQINISPSVFYAKTRKYYLKTSLQSILLQLHFLYYKTTYVIFNTINVLKNLLLE